MSSIPLSIAEIYELAYACLRNHGCNDANAAAVARTVSSAEQDGAVSHGLFRIPGYLKSLKSGKVDGNAQPTAEHVTPAVIRINGNNGFAPLALEFGIPLLAEAAKTIGVAVMTLQNSFHYAALWPEVEAIAAHELVGMACTAHTPTVAPYGAKKAFFSTNPLAFAYPRPSGKPYVFDMATAAKARGDIGVAARDGHQLPLGIGLDSDGNPTTDAKKIHQGGVILPFGGYKGSAIATMVELLCAGLTGDFFSYEALEHDKKDGKRDGGPARGGQFLVAFSPKLLAGDEWAEHSEDFLTRLENMEGVRLPGQRRFANRASDAPREVNAELVGQLRELATG